MCKTTASSNGAVNYNGRPQAKDSFFDRLPTAKRRTTLQVIVIQGKDFENVERINRSLWESLSFSMTFSVFGKTRHMIWAGINQKIPEAVLTSSVKINQN
jgi:hypothetical protein